MEYSKLIDLFWKKMGGSIHREYEVFVASEMMNPRDIVSNMGHTVPGLEKFVGEGLLFWVDKIPPANFGHPTEYILLGEDGQVVRAEADWPPAKPRLETMKKIYPSSEYVS